MNSRTGSHDPPRGLLVTGRGLLLPAAIWTLYFAGIYAIQGAGCSAAVEPPGSEGFGPLRAILLVVTLVAAGGIALTGVLSYRTWRRMRPAEERDTANGRAAFLAQGTLLNAGLFLVATLWIGLPVLMFEPCLGHTVW